MIFFKMADSKKLRFPKSPILNFMEKPKKCIFCLFLSLCRTVSQPYKLGHINALCINQGSIHKIFAKFFWELAILEISVFLSRPFWKKKSTQFFFCFIPMKISQSFLGSKDGSKFWWLPWFPAKNHPPQFFLSRMYIHCALSKIGT